MNLKNDHVRWMAGVITAAVLAFSVGAFTSSPANSQAGSFDECPLTNQFCGNADDETPPDLGVVNGAKNGLGNGATNGVLNGAINGVVNGVPNGIDNGVPNGFGTEEG